MSEFEVKCPKCGTVITANDVMKKHLEQQEELIRNETKKEVDAIKANAKREADKENKETIDVIQKNAKKEVDAAKAEADKVKKEVDAIKANAKREADKENKETIDKLKKDKEIADRRMQNKIDEMQRQIDQKSNEVQGEVQEELIEDFISAKFPSDQLDTIKKGANGADSILTIRSTNNESIGKILIESKNTKDFSQPWIPKLLTDLKNSNADVGIIITKALPKSDFPSNIGYKPYEGGLVCVVEFKYPLVHMLLEMIRNKIILSKKNKDTTNVPNELNKLWDLITGPKFVTQFRLLYNHLKKIDDASKKIDSTIRKQTADQQKHISDSIDIQKEMILNMVTTVGSESLPTKLMEFDDDN
tara:strand:- start:1363 stop:2442 length:1080 start_codon:yes stop_codon:yes gene_type:complete